MQKIKKLKKTIKKRLLGILKVLPVRSRRKLNHLINNSFNQESGELGGQAIFELDTLQGLAKDSEYMMIYRNCLSKAGDTDSDNIYKILRHINLYSYVENILLKNIPGEFAECGVWNGNSFFATKYLIDKHKSSKSIYLFDSFEGGLSEFKEEALKGSSIISGIEAEQVRRQFRSSYPSLVGKTKDLSNVFINKGWIPAILNKQQDRSYSFVHIDVDLYEPTFESHKYFFERMSKGGIIVCDDYGYKQFPGAAKAVDDFIATLTDSSYSHFIKLSIGTSIIIK